MVCRGLVLLLLFDAAPAVAQDCSELGVGELGQGLVEHSCFHTTFGPFVEVVAEMGETATAATPNVDTVHTYYSVRLTPNVVNVVTYRPERTGNWVLFREADLPQRVLRADGSEVPVLLSHAVPSCSGLPEARVFPLEAGQRYRILLGPTPRAQTFVELEKVSDFDTVHGRDADGDGFGTDAETLTTPCVPPAGYVANVSDCADDEKVVHPGATEECNGVDDDCDGLVDDEACRLGGGGCQTAPGATGAAWFVALLLGLGTWLSHRRRRVRSSGTSPHLGD
jgi:hypothetical protein